MSSDLALLWRNAFELALDEGHGVTVTRPSGMEMEWNSRTPGLNHTSLLRKKHGIIHEVLSANAQEMVFL